MRAKENAIVHDCFSLLDKSSKEQDYQITAIYYRRNRNDAVDVLACAIDSLRTEIIAFDPYKGIDVKQRKWDFSIDDYEFKSLEDGYEILYMPLDTHITMWTGIGNMQSSNIKNHNGIQRYLLYCKQNGIDKELIETLTTNVWIIS